MRADNSLLSTCLQIKHARREIRHEICLLLLFIKFFDGCIGEDSVLDKAWYTGNFDETALS